MSTAFHIAIDGPVAAGKGTVSRLVAERLGFVYVDTGSMYRMTALLALRNNLDFNDEAALVPLVTQANMDMHSPLETERDSRLVTVLLDGEDVSWKIRTEEISAAAAKVAQLAEVRRVLVEKQQKIAIDKNVVMEGRDITYRVLPEAQLKIFLTASDIVRAKRRHNQLLSKGEDIPFQEVYKELVGRDEQDSRRAADPLKIIPEAWVIDTSDLNIEEAVEVIVARTKMMMS